MLTLVIADDHPIVLAGLTQLFRQEAGVRVVASCVNGVEALEAARLHRPDAMLLDINMPKLDGFGVLRTLASEHSPVAVVVLTADADASDVAAARAAGARGIVLKELSPRHVVDCVRLVYSGSEWVEFIGQAREAMSAPSRSASQPRETFGLTPRELELTSLVVSGLKNRDVAARLGISEGTAKLHLYNVYKKLGVANRVELVLRVRSAGLTDV
jgi:two-component system nitrate/nitrite response regulator NarL